VNIRKIEFYNAPEWKPDNALAEESATYYDTKKINVQKE